MKDNFDAQALERRLCAIEEVLCGKADLAFAYDLEARLRYCETEYAGAGQVATLDYQIRKLQEDIALLRKAIQDSLLYNPDDLRYDDII